MPQTLPMPEASTVPFSEIPQIDVGPLGGGDAAARKAVGRAIERACREVGFFYIRNHGVPQPVIDALFGASVRFFAQPEEEKQTISSEKSLQHRGYVGPGQEQTDPTYPGRDLHEGLDFGREPPEGQEPDTKARSLYGPNQFPAGVPEMEPAVRAYYAAMLDLGNRLLRGFALGLNLDEGYFLDKFDHAAGWLRLLHYPPQPPRAEDGAIGIGAHTDYECFTILAQDPNGGLQVRNVAGEWIHAPPVEGTFVVNVADLMARWTNDRFRSTLHRVINRTGRERHSVAFFLGPNADTEITSIPTCVPEGTRPKYEPVKAGEWILARVKAALPDLVDAP